MITVISNVLTPVLGAIADKGNEETDKNESKEQDKETAES